MLDVLERRSAGLPLHTAVQRVTDGTAALGLGVRRGAAAAPRARPAGAVPPDPPRTEPRDRGRVLRAGRGADPVRRLPARVLPARLLAPLARAGPDGADRGGLRRRGLAVARWCPGSRSRWRCRARPSSTASGSSSATHPTSPPSSPRSSVPVRAPPPTTVASRRSGRWTRSSSATPAGWPRRSRTATGPTGGRTEAVLPDEDPQAGSPDLHRASVLFDRMVGYLDAAR